MDYKIMSQFENIKLTEEVKWWLERIGLSEADELDLYDLFYRLNKFGLDPRMLGSRLSQKYPNGVGKVIFHEWVLTVSEYDYEELVIVDIYKTHLRCI